VPTVMLPDLDGDLEATLDTMPSYVGHSAQCCVKDLLQTDPRSRLGSGRGGAQDVKVRFFFQLLLLLNDVL
jgi:hypothetical protein